MSDSLEKKVEGLKRPVANTSRGFLYEVKIILLLALRAERNGYKFWIMSNMKDVWGFDDIVFKFVDSNGKSQIYFIQTKHKQNTEATKIDLKLLLGKIPDFNLFKYFIDYNKTKKSFNREHDVIFKDTFEQSNCTFYLYTNCVIAKKLNEIGTDHILSSGGFEFKFGSEEQRQIIMEFKNQQKFERNGLVKALTECILNNKIIDTKNIFLKKFQSILINKVIEVEKGTETGKFRISFLNGVNLSQGEQKFRRLFLEKSSQSKPDLTENELIIFLSDKSIKVDKNFSKLKENEQSDLEFPNDYVEAEIEEYLQNLKIFTNQPNETEIDQIILQELKKTSKFKIQAKIHFHFVLEKISNWWQDDQSDYLTDNTIKTFLTKSNHQNNYLKLFALSADFKLKAANYGIQFKNNTINELHIENFFSHETIQILNIVSNQNILTAIKMCQCISKFYKEEYILIKLTSFLNYIDDVEDALEEEIVNLLIIECDSKSGEEEFYKTITPILNKNQKLKIILMCEEGNTLNTRFEDGFKGNYSKHIDQNNFFDLTNESQRNLLKYPITFQGNEITFQELIADIETIENHITAEDVCGIIQNNLKIADVSNGFEDINFYIERKLSRDVSHNMQPEIKENFYVNNLNNIFNRVFIIVAEPGMGKTTFINHLVVKEKEINPTTWIIKIILNECTDSLNKIKTEHKEINNEDLINFLATKQKLKTSLEKELLKQNLLSKGGVTLFIDGFDEICPDYKDTVIKLLQIITQNSKTEKIVITSHLRYKHELENKLGASPYTFTPFSKLDQKYFLEKFWVHQLDLQDDKMEKVSEYVEKLLSVINETLHNTESEFMGLPLQSRMVAEAFQDDVSKYTDSAAAIKLPIKLDMLNLYRYFIETKFTIYFQDKSHLSPNNVNFKRLISPLKAELEEKHKYYSIKMLFNYVHNTLFPRYEEKSTEGELQKVGIIEKIKGNRILFTHRTFAEYFAALWFSENWQKIERHLLQKIIFSEENEIIRNLFDRFLCEGKELHNAVLNNDPQKVQELLQNGENVNCLDSGGRTPLHLANYFNLYEIMVILTDNDAYTNVEDEIFNWKPANYFFENEKTWKKLQKLYNYSLDKKSLPRTLHVIAAFSKTKGKNNVDEYLNSALHFAALFDCKENFQMLLEREVDVNYSNKFGFTPLHITAWEGNMEFGRLLIENDANVNKMNKNNETPLFYVAMEGHIEFGKLLIEKGATVNAVDENNETPLFKAVLNGHLEFGKLLIRKGANVNVVNKNNETPLFYAAFNGHVEFGKLLIENRANVDAVDENNETPLLKTVSNGQLEFSKLLIEKGANVNVVNKNNETLLFTAIARGQIKFGQLLIEKGADVNARNKNNKTPLLKAASNNRMEFGKLLIEKGANVNAMNKNNETPLFKTVLHGHLEFAKLLIKNSANVNATNKKNEETPLFKAAIRGHVVFGKLLIENGANVNARNKNNETPIFNAALHGQVEFGKLLLEKGANLNAINKNNETPLFNAARKDRTEFGKLLIEKGANVNVVNIDNETALFNAASSGSVEFGKLLIENGLNVNIVNKNNATLLFNAIAWGQIKFGQLLIEKGADINAANERNETPLFKAALSGSVEFGKLLIEKGANVNAINKNKETPLFNAVLSGRMIFGKLLIDHGANVNFMNNNNETPLFNAALRGETEFGKLLIENGANVNAVNEKNETPLFKAALSGLVEFGKLLIEKGANVNFVNKNNKTPLLYAAKWGHTNFEKLLKENGANVANKK